MSDEKKDIEEKERKCYCGIEGCNIECGPISFEDEEKDEKDGCNEPSCHI